MKKEDINYVFEQNPELPKIGTKTQYYKYLQGIFPESKINDIVYHGTANEFEKEEFDKSKLGKTTKSSSAKKGFFFTKSRNIADSFGNLSREVEALTKEELKDKRRLELSQFEIPWTKTESERYENYFKKIRNKNLFLIPSILNIPLFYSFNAEGKSNSELINENTSIYKIIEFALNEGYQGVEFINIIDSPYDSFSSTNYVVFEPSQIHILGSKKDIQGFKDFVKNHKATSLENKLLTGVFITFVISGLFFSTPSLTGNVISSKFVYSNVFGLILFIVGIVGFFIIKFKN